MKRIIPKVILALIIIGIILFAIFIYFVWEESGTVFAADSQGRDPETTVIGIEERLSRTAFDGLFLGAVIYIPTGILGIVYYRMNRKGKSKRD